jgi:hypothetical protein
VFSTRTFPDGPGPEARCHSRKPYPRVTMMQSGQKWPLSNIQTRNVLISDHVPDERRKVVQPAQYGNGARDEDAARHSWPRYPLSTQARSISRPVILSGRMHRPVEHQPLDIARRDTHALVCLRAISSQKRRRDSRRPLILVRLSLGRNQLGADCGGFHRPARSMPREYRQHGVAPLTARTRDPPNRANHR